MWHPPPSLGRFGAPARRRCPRIAGRVQERRLEVRAPGGVALAWAWVLEVLWWLFVVGGCQTPQLKLIATLHEHPPPMVAAASGGVPPGLPPIGVAAGSQVSAGARRPLCAREPREDVGLGGGR